MPYVPMLQFDCFIFLYGPFQGLKSCKTLDFFSISIKSILIQNQVILTYKSMHIQVKSMIIDYEFNGKQKETIIIKASHFLQDVFKLFTRLFLSNYVVRRCNSHLITTPNGVSYHRLIDSNHQSCGLGHGTGSLNISKSALKITK